MYTNSISWTMMQHDYRLFSDFLGIIVDDIGCFKDIIFRRITSGKLGLFDVYTTKAYTFNWIAVNNLST